MFKNRRLFGRLTRRMFVGFLVLWALLRLGPPGPTAWAEESDSHDLRLRCSLAKSELAPYEPLVAVIELENVSAEPQTIVPTMNPQYDRLKVEVTFPNETIRRYQSVIHASTISEIKATLAPNDVLKHREAFYYDSELGFLFVLPGVYRLQFTYAPWPTSGDTIKSNAIDVTVRSGRNLDFKAMSQFRQGVHAMRLGAVNWRQVTVNHLSRVIAEHPDSEYAPWAHCFLGWLAQTEEDFPRPHASRAAIKHYTQVLNDAPTFPLAIEIRYEIAKEMMRLGERKQALAQLKGLVDVDPDLWLLRGVARVLDTDIHAVEARNIAAQLPDGVSLFR